MIMSREWAMPNHDTFSIKPIGSFVQRYLSHSTVSVDPFARNKRWSTHTNDLNPTTEAECHMKAFDFLAMLVSKGVKADLVVFDPPYSLRQTKECYEGIGIKFTYEDTLNVGLWQNEKKICNELLSDNGVFLQFGWHSNAMGKKYGFEIQEILLVAHGRSHNDTICVAEKRNNNQQMLSL